MVAVDPAHLVGTGGAIGALCRYYLTQHVQMDEFPLGVLTVNVLGSFVLGLVTFAGLNNDLVLFVGVGACGSFTTFSSFSFATVRLWQDGYQSRAIASALGNLIGALVAIGIAWGAVTVWVAHSVSVMPGKEIDIQFN